MIFMVDGVAKKKFTGWTASLCLIYYTVKLKCHCLYILFINSGTIESRYHLIQHKLKQAEKKERNVSIINTVRSTIREQETKCFKRKKIN